MAERMVEVGGVALCTESFGDPADPPVLLVMGIGASMLWWDEGFCRMLAEGGRFVIRYDHRDTGRSVTYPPGRPGYTGADLVDDAARVLDAHRIPAAHVLGVSAGGALAQLLALRHAERVLSLVLVSTSPAVPGDDELPPPTEEFLRFVATPAAGAPDSDASDSNAPNSNTADTGTPDADAVVEQQVAYARVLAGGRRAFDEEAVRDLVRREAARARNVAAARNHEVLAEGDRPPVSLSSIAVPTLVIHGTADPMFPLQHGQALAERVPGARLLPLPDAGHGVERPDWPAIVRAALDLQGGDGESAVPAPGDGRR